MGFVLFGFMLLFVFGLGITSTNGCLAPNPHFDKILVFVSTLIGSITGYYFGGEHAKAAARAAAAKPG
jgi:hypothetical protein